MNVGVHNKLSKIKSLIKSETLQSKIDLLTDKDIKQIYINSHTIKVSLVMITKNQGGIIEKVLSKIKLLNINELVVVDTGSTDNTKLILEKDKDVSLHEISWQEDYSFMRNASARLVDTDWILTLDSDEILLTMDFDIKFFIGVLMSICDDEFAISFEQHNHNFSSYGIPAKLYNPKWSQYFGLVHEELRSLSTGIPTKFVLTSIKIENLGTDKSEIERFSKNERYGELLLKMMNIEPENPRWFVLLPEEYIEKLVQKGTYEKLIISYLFKSSDCSLKKEKIQIGTFTRMIFEKYVAFLITNKRISEAKQLVTFAISLYPMDICLIFYQDFLQINQIKENINKLLKEKLKAYLSFDKKLYYDYNFRNLELLEMSIAELSFLKGDFNMASKIIHRINDQNVLEIWGNWHKEDTRGEKV